jgi:hypothetical protein
MRTRENATTRRLLRRGLLVALLVCVALVGVVVVTVDPTALCLLPALAFAVPLLMGLYPGERTIAVLFRSRQRRWAHPRSSAPSTRPVVRVVARGGLLLARSLAVRPPPPVILAGS